jgi:hypothetical protein
VGEMGTQKLTYTIILLVPIFSMLEVLNLMQTMGGVFVKDRCRRRRRPLPNRMFNYGLRLFRALRPFLQMAKRRLMVALNSELRGTSERELAAQARRKSPKKTISTRNSFLKGMSPRGRVSGLARTTSSYILRRTTSRLRAQTKSTSTMPSTTQKNLTVNLKDRLVRKAERCSIERY